MKKQGKEFRTAMTLFSLTGQAAWGVGIMCLSAFIYKTFHAQPEDISLLAGVSSAVAVLLIGILGKFVKKERTPEGTGQESYLQVVIYSFRPSVYQANKLLYAVIAIYALFHISIQTFMPYLIMYYEKTLQMRSYVTVFVPALVIASVVTAVYGNYYEQLGFQTSVVPVAGMLAAGDMILYAATTTVPVFIGTVIMLSGYLSGIAVFSAKIREQIPEHMAERFQSVRMMGQVLIPGTVGSAIGAFALRSAGQTVNRNIWMAALVMTGILWIALQALFRMIRLGHYDLWTESGMCLKEKRLFANRWKSNEKQEEKPWNTYPRPQMRREGYLMLNEGWKLNGKPFLMPFPPQSALSGYEGKVGTKLTYETCIEIPKTFTKERILLHFGAVDQIAEVWVNGKYAGKHEGGYLPFYFDITDLVIREGVNRIVVKVTDALSGAYPYGKQCKKRGGMWYTPVSGIWQSVWLENVPAFYIEKITITPDLNGIDVEISGEGIDGFEVNVALSNHEIYVRSFEGCRGRMELTEHICTDGKAYQPKLWSPETPYLYEMQIQTEYDCVKSYFALRTIEICNREGVNRVCLNGKPVFLHGVLDQGYYPDGIFLPAEPEEYERDILRMKELGFNFLRKHIKVETEAFYYYCDKHGMLVMQDMVNNGGYSFIFDTALPTLGLKTKKDTGVFGHGVCGKTRTKEIFRRHLKETIEHVYNHPCIIAYTLFNEGWGQFDSDTLYDLSKSLDNTRLVDSTSGWFWQKKNDFDSEHIYFKTIELDVKERPMLVSECGGYSYVVEGHCFSKYNTYGYGGAEDAAELTQRITDMYRGMILPGIAKGVCGCVYTQLSDVEDEINGLYTYDRQLCKVEKEQMYRLAEELYQETASIM